MSTTHADVLVIGAGVAGGVFARRCVEAGLSVVCLEQGDWVDRADYPGGMFGGIDSTHTARGDNGGASRFFYCAKVSTRERAGSKHPTMKPLALTEYLARLIMPPRPGLLLVPFAGSGSEMIGALRAGWAGVVGIEREAEYVETARRRLETVT